jgi:hypothetical protein
LKLEDIDKRLKEIPLQVQELAIEQNQLLGYKQALLDIEKPKEDKKNSKEK